MSLYRVQIEYDQRFDLEIEADSEEDAEEKAMDKIESDKEYPYVCVTILVDSRVVIPLEESWHEEVLVMTNQISLLDVGIERWIRV